MLGERRWKPRVDSRYYQEIAMAAIRGYLARHTELEGVESRLLSGDLQELTAADCDALLQHARRLELPTHYFKRNDRMLPRLRSVLGFLKSISFDSLLDVGSGRGAFLFPFLDLFPWVEVCSLDLLERRVKMLSDVSRGGVDRLRVMQADICLQPLPEGSVDVVTMLEVLEHIPNVDAAVRAAVRMARKFVVVTVPSKADDNPEHIHLLTRERLTQLFGACGVERLSFDAVPGHLLLIANLGG